MIHRRAALTITRSVAALFLLIAATLAGTNYLLLRRIAALRTQLDATTIARVKINQPEPGRVVPPLTGADRNGMLVTYGYGGATPKTLLMVLSPTCGVCDANWPQWRRLMSLLDGASVRVVAVNLAPVLEQAYVAKYGLDSMNLLWAVDPKHISQYGFVFTPQTVLIDGQGTIERVWTGVLSDDDLREAVASSLAPTP